MLQFAFPLGLLALGALLAPLLLHLVRRPVRVVKVGSLRQIEHERRAIRSLRWDDRVLLLIRCALLAALALALAGLHWRPVSTPPARWLLLAPGAMLDAASQAEWRRLQAEGFSPRRLAAGFPAFTAASASEAGAPPVETDAWSLLRELDARLPSGSQAVVFGPTRADRFHGPRPTLTHVRVRWHATPEPTDTAAATPTSVRVGLVAASNREEDARYLRAALTVAGATFAPVDQAPDWVFQLGEIALPSSWQERVRRGGRLITDAPEAAAPTRVSSWFDSGSTTVHLRQRVMLDAGVPVWRDSRGEPLYSEAPYERGIHGRFALRFNPEWSDWPLSGAFPAWWRSQLQPGATPAPVLAPEQAAPHFVPAPRHTKPDLAGFGRVDLRSGCWWLAVLLFALERALSLRGQRRKAAA
jgi:hypothetical protein